MGKKREYKYIKEGLSDLWCKLEEILEVMKEIRQFHINDIHAKVLEELNSKPRKNRRRYEHN